MAPPWWGEEGEHEGIVCGHVSGWWRQMCPAQAGMAIKVGMDGDHEEEQQCGQVLSIVTATLWCALGPLRRWELLPVLGSKSPDAQ